MTPDQGGCRPSLPHHRHFRPPGHAELRYRVPMIVKGSGTLLKMNTVRPGGMLCWSDSALDRIYEADAVCMARSLDPEGAAIRDFAKSGVLEGILQGSHVCRSLHRAHMLAHLAAAERPKAT